MRSIGTYVLKVVFLAFLYVISGKLGLLLAIPPGYATAVWPPSGIALAALLLMGPRVLPGVALGSFALNLWISIGNGLSLSSKVLLISIGLGLGASIQAYVGFTLIRKTIGLPHPLDTTASVLKFFLLGGLASCLVNSINGVCILWYVGFIPGPDLFNNWWNWWIGDAIGILTITPLALILFGQPRHHWRNRTWPVALPLLSIFATIVALFFWNSGLEQQRIRTEFIVVSNAVENSLRNNLSYAIEANLAVSDFYYGSSEVTRKEFDSFATSQVERHPSVSFLSFIMCVPNSERMEYERLLAASGMPVKEIRELDSNGNFVRAGNRSEYFPVHYIAPISGNERAVGFDLNFEAERSAALHKANESGKITATGLIKLVQPDATGILIFQPIYKNIKGRSLSDKSAGLIGVASAVIKVEKLVLDALSPEFRDIDIQIIDKMAAQGKQTLYLLGDPIDESPGKNKIVFSKDFTIGGRDWNLRLQPTKTYLRERGAWYSSAVLAAGLILLSILCAFLLILTGRNMTIELAVVARTQELAQSNGLLMKEVVERQLAQDSLTVSEELLRQLIHHAPAAIAMLDNNMRYLQASDRWRIEYKLQGKEIEGKSHYEIFPDIPDRWKEIHKRVLEGVVEHCDEDPFPRKDGSTEWLQWECRPWKKSDGNIGGLIFFTQVITARKQAEEHLRESEERFRSAFEYSAIGFALVSLTGKWIQVNRALCGLVGYSSEELLKLTFQDITVPEDLEADMENVKQLLADKISHYHMEKRYLSKSGEIVWVHLNVSLVRDGQHQPLYFVSQIQNITERKRAEESLLKSLQEKELLLREIHHRVKNNMQIISSLLNLQAFSTDDDRFTKLLEKSQKRITAMALVHQQLYQTHHLSKVKFKEYAQQLCQSICTSYHDSSGIFNVVVDVDDTELSIDEAIPCALIANEWITNAYKYAFPVGKRGTVTFSFRRVEKEYKLSVSDNGVGLPDGFNPDKLSSLGTKLVKMLAAQLGGKFSFSSGALTIFEVNFPVIAYEEGA